MNFPTARLASLVLPVGLLIALNSCKEEGCVYDNALNYDPKAEVDDGSCLFDQKPVIEIVSPVSEMYGTDSLHVQFSAADDIGLKRYRYEVVRAENQEVVYWSQGDISNAEFKVSEDIYINPSMEAFEFLSYYGEYEFNVEVVDNNGLQTEHQVNYKLLDTVSPMISMYWNFSNNVWYGPRHVAVTAEDLGSIAEINVELFRWIDNQAAYLLDDYQETYLARKYNFQSVIYYLSDKLDNASAGSQYRVKVSVKDWYDNVRVRWTDVGTVQ